MCIRDSAYGVELQRVCAYVDCVELATGKQVRLTAKECRFGYRDSILKRIVARGLTMHIVIPVSYTHLVLTSF